MAAGYRRRQSTCTPPQGEDKIVSTRGGHFLSQLPITPYMGVQSRTKEPSFRVHSRTSCLSDHALSAQAAGPIKISPARWQSGCSTDRRSSLRTVPTIQFGSVTSAYGCCEAATGAAPRLNSATHIAPERKARAACIYGDFAAREIRRVPSDAKLSIATRNLLASCHSLRDQPPRSLRLRAEHGNDIGFVQRGKVESDATMRRIAPIFARRTEVKFLARNVSGRLFDGSVAVQWTKVLTHRR